MPPRCWTTRKGPAGRATDPRTGRRKGIEAAHGHAAISVAVPDQHPRPPVRAERRRSAGRPRSTTSRTRSWINSRVTVSTWSGCWASGRRARRHGASRRPIPSGWPSTTASCRTSEATTSADRPSRSGLPRARRLRRRRGAGAAARAPAAAGTAADARLRPQPRRARSRLGASTPSTSSRAPRSRLAAAPQNWTRVTAGGTSRILAYGRDPYFAGWPDTLQLNYGNRTCRRR